MINLHEVEDLALECGGIVTVETAQEALTDGRVGRRTGFGVEASQRCPLVGREIKRFRERWFTCAPVVAAAGNIS